MNDHFRPADMQRLDWFAAHAPAVPDWFKPVLPEFPRTPSLAVDWETQARFHEYLGLVRKRQPIPDHLLPYKENWEKRREEAAIEAAVTQELTTFQWAAYYAKKMVEALNAVEGK